MSKVTRSVSVLVCAIALSSSAFAALPQAFKNSVKYKDAGAKPATGRSGSAAIQARALRGQSQTDIEVTTGDFDGGAPVGVLDKVQVKLFTNAGDVATDNYRNIGGGYGRFAYAAAPRGQAFQVQANVSGIDPKRTDVVTVAGNVKWRPDLTVASVQAPSQAYVGSVVTVNAVVRETLGDSGARANCVLSADGAVVDHADGIWVDAGDAVTCQFRTVFASVGTKNLTVAVTNVVPADFNLDNNSAGASINIVPTGTPVFYTFSAADQYYDSQVPAQEHDEFTSSSTSYQSYVRDYSDNQVSTTHVVSYGANLQLEQALEFPVAIQGRLVSDGQTLLETNSSVDYNPSSFMNFSGDGYWNKCGDSYDGWTWVFMCHFHSEFDGVVRDLSTTFSSVNAGSVTYASFGTSLTRYADGTSDVYTFNYNGSYTTGPLLAPMPPTLGNHVDVFGAFTDAQGTHAEHTVGVDLYPFDPVTFDYGPFCFTSDYTLDGWGHMVSDYCAHPVTTERGTQGESHGEFLQQ